jgi:hypothetical protein
MDLRSWPPEIENLKKRRQVPGPGRPERAAVNSAQPPTGRVPFWIALGLVALVISPLLVGIEPVGGDPDELYRPIKSELSRTLREGRLPYWSDRFGVGLPLVAESHVAAYYPLNLACYRLLDIATAYRFLMGLHILATVAATYAYARSLGIGGWGSSLAGVGFTLGGFQAAHAMHEPFYCTMPYLPFCLFLAERFLASGKPGWLASLALSWGFQVFLGHFQIQLWTAGLATLTALCHWRRLGGTASGRRVAALVFGLFWGGMIAWVQIQSTRELTRVSSFNRPPSSLALFSFPPSHLAQWALPAVYLIGFADSASAAQNRYWGQLSTIPDEASAYLGVEVLLLSMVGFVSVRRHRVLGMWRILSVLGLVLATMPRWWPDGFTLLLNLPVVGWFRAPGRYMLWPSLGLALLAGRGFDRALVSWRFWLGLVLAVGLGAAAWVWTIVLTSDPLFRECLGASTLSLRFAASAAAWLLGIGVLVAWRSGWLGSGGPIVLAAVELGSLYYFGPTTWGWSVRLPGDSPILSRLAREPDRNLIGGRIQNLPVRLGWTVAYPQIGITAPPPNYLLELAATKPPGLTVEAELRWQRRLGVSHGIWRIDDDIQGTTLLASGADDSLESILDAGQTRPPDERGWQLVRYDRPFPAAWVAPRARLAADWSILFPALSRDDLADEAWFLLSDRPAEAKKLTAEQEEQQLRGSQFSAAMEQSSSIGSVQAFPPHDQAPPPPIDLDLGPPAHSYRVASYDGRTAVVEHDGSCVLILRRAYYPGWVARIDGGSARPVYRVNGGLQAIVLTGSGTQRIELIYHPTNLQRDLAVSFVALAAALALLAAAPLRAVLARNQPGNESQ